jgi:hypothetical protein
MAKKSMKNKGKYVAYKTENRKALNKNKLYTSTCAASGGPTVVATKDKETVCHTCRGMKTHKK